ncbi:MAG: SIS domain-containing protein [Bacteroidales bacterium]
MNIADLQKGITDSIETKIKILEDDLLMDKLLYCIDIMSQSLREGRCIFFCGNGGSAADAQHLAAELTGRYYYDRPPLNAEALHVDTSYLTAVANDYAYNEIYARLLKGKGQKGDILVGISTSGNSENVYKAFEQAKQMGIITLAMIGEKGGKMREIADICLVVPSLDTPRIQESHILLGHLLCQGIESTLFPQN